jgi:hypothetical protein
LGEGGGRRRALEPLGIERDADGRTEAERLRERLRELREQYEGVQP